MKKIKSLLIAVAGISAIALPVAAVSCNNSGPSLNGAQWPAVKVAQITKDNLTKEQLDATNVQAFPSIAVVTDSGLWDDKSFNQSAVEGALTLRDQINAIYKETETKTVKDEQGKDKVVETDKWPEGKKMVVNVIQPTEGQYNKTYDALLAGGSKVWILSGFQHKTPLTSYLEAKEAQLKSQGIIIIGIDFSIPTAKYPNFYSLSFKVQESAYIVGQTVAEFLGAKEAAARTTTSFGGGVFPGVTDFITGYLKGIMKYDETNADKLTTITGETAQPANSLVLNTDFKPNDKMKNTINTLLKENPSVILPVAGSATGLTLTAIRDQGRATQVIGVDVDQTLSFPDFKGKLVTSITKNVGQAVYDTLLYSIFKIDHNNVFAQFTADQAKNVTGTYKQHWVGYAKSQLADPEQAKKVNELLDKYAKEFESLDAQTIEYIDAWKVSPTDSKTYTGEEQQALVDALVQKINSLKK
ncbi:BMP family ABC transporter substrate-binding protein [Mycoplasma sp. HF14]